jgi:hypothetical protein
MQEAERVYKRFEEVDRILGTQRSAIRKSQLDEQTKSEKLQQIEIRADIEHRRMLSEYFRSMRSADAVQ